MRIFLTFLILILSFQSWIKADDISEFEIEGISIGDSLLDHFDKNNIEKEISSEFSRKYKNKFIGLGVGQTKEFPLFKKLDQFDELSITIKPNDKNYIIYGLSQYKRIEYDNCLNETTIIIKDLKKLFSQLGYDLNEYTTPHQGDPSGNSTVTSSDFNFNDGSSLRIMCVDWGKEFEADGYHDHIDVGLASSKFFNWLKNEAFK